MHDVGSTQVMEGLSQHPQLASQLAQLASPPASHSTAAMPQARKHQVEALMAQLHAASSANPQSLPQAPRRTRLQIISQLEQDQQARPSPAECRQQNLQVGDLHICSISRKPLLCWAPLITPPSIPSIPAQLCKTIRSGMAAHSWRAAFWQAGHLSRWAGTLEDGWLHLVIIAAPRSHCTWQVSSQGIGAQVAVG